MAPERSSTRKLIAALIAVALVVGLTACGNQSTITQDRPPSSIEVSARIGPRGVEVSPANFGTGLANITIANLTDLPAGLAIEGPIRLATREIQPGESANLQGDFSQGTYEVVAVTGVETTRTSFTVGPPRENSNRELLLP